MSKVIEMPTTTSITESAKCFHQVFLTFRQPDGSVSLFYGDGDSGCGIYKALGEIFERTPREIYDVMYELAFKGGDGFMQEYLSLEAASNAVGKASMFAHVSQCFCFRKQGANFFIRERRA